MAVQYQIRLPEPAGGSTEYVSVMLVALVVITLAPMALTLPSSTVTVVGILPRPWGMVKTLLTASPLAVAVPPFTFVPKTLEINDILTIRLILSDKFIIKMLRKDICCDELFLSISKNRHVLQDDIDRENEKWIIITEYLPPQTYSHVVEADDVIPITPLKLPICPFCYKVWNKRAIIEKKEYRRMKKNL